jgi:hypothetical protein
MPDSMMLLFLWLFDSLGFQVLQLQLAAATASSTWSRVLQGASPNIESME